MQQKFENKVNNNFIKTIEKLLKTKNDNISTENIEYINSIMIENELQKQKLIDIIINCLINTSKKNYTIEKILLQKLQNIINQKFYNKLNQAFSYKFKENNKQININYQLLQQLLMQSNFQEADKLTQICLCQLSQIEKPHNRNWLYFTDINLIPSYDLFLIDLLWQIYSQEKFGLYTQRKIWLINNKNWDIFLEKIGWTNKSIMKKYPEEFEWNINAPQGHLPLFNQLRGNKVLIQLFKHNMWQEYYK